jgi:hypothetical protein
MILVDTTEAAIDDNKSKPEEREEEKESVEKMAEEIKQDDSPAAEVKEVSIF